MKNLILKSILLIIVLKSNVACQKKSFEDTNTGSSNLSSSEISDTENKSSSAQTAKKQTLKKYLCGLYNKETNRLESKIKLGSKMKDSVSLESDQNYYVANHTDTGIALSVFETSSGNLPELPLKMLVQKDTHGYIFIKDNQMINCDSKLLCSAAIKENSEFKLLESPVKVVSKKDGSSTDLAPQYAINTGKQFVAQKNPKEPLYLSFFNSNYVNGDWETQVEGTAIYNKNSVSILNGKIIFTCQETK